MTLRIVLFAAGLACTTAAAASAQTARPPIVGVSHIALKTDDLAAARNFYGRDLGFAEPFSLDKPTAGCC
jgi:catechol-2,3-dioxygenase